MSEQFRHRCLLCILEHCPPPRREGREGQRGGMIKDQEIHQARLDENMYVRNVLLKRGLLLPAPFFSPSFLPPLLFFFFLFF